MFPLLLVLAGIGIFEYSEFQKFQSQYKWKVKDVSIDYQKTLNSDFKFLYYNIIFTIGNPTNFSITLDKISSELVYAGINLGTFHRNEPTKLLANQQLRITGSVVIDIEKATSALTPLIKNLKQGKHINYDLKTSFVVFQFFTINNTFTFSAL